MMSDYKRILVTSALPYANGPVHIGHLAGVYVPADIYVRYQRMRGREVLFVCGSDEHGVPVTQRARKEGITPQQVVDRYHSLIKKSFEDFGIGFDIYSRTTSATHHEFAAQFFRKLYDDGKLIERTSKQYYDEEVQEFLTDRDIVGECPHCGNPDAYGNQCEKCGRDLSPEELINPRSKRSKSTPVLRETKNWYLPLNEYEPWLRDWILEQHKEWRPNVYGQCKSWLDSGLQPRAMTRDLDWGIPVPVEGAEGKVLYVWFDAPIGYISNTKELCEREPGKWGAWQKWWQDEDTKLVHFIGKDNIVFHCIIFPSMMKAHGKYIMPDNVPANEFLNLENDKISTSKNWAVWLNEYLEDFPGMQDVLRYVLTANAPETKDNNFTWKDYQDRNNSELVAIYGNFVNRAVVLTHKYFDGKVPANAKPEAIDAETLAQLPQIRAAIEDDIEHYKFREALKEAMNLARIGNKYISDTEPWKVAKTDIDRTASILYTSLQICANLAIAFSPFLPFSSEKLRQMLCLDKLSWDSLGNAEVLQAGHQIAPAQLMFAKIEDSQIDAQIAKLQATKAEHEAAAAAALAETPAPAKAECVFEDFEKMDIRTATVLEAEKVPNTDKLLHLKIDTGLDVRELVSGIAQYYTPEEMVGKQICILANLKPRKIKGIVSQGMILMAQQPDGKMRVVSPEERLSNGATIG
ncbi:MAG: methionine--tRNA ligase [Bacteroidales bacterium]|nr:methionine--tRNA ligase [Bacteroidales bacterium]